MIFTNPCTASFLLQKYIHSILCADHVYLPNLCGLRTFLSLISWCYWKITISWSAAGPSWPGVESCVGVNFNFFVFKSLESFPLLRGSRLFTLLYNVHFLGIPNMFRWFKTLSKTWVKLYIFLIKTNEYSKRPVKVKCKVNTVDTPHWYL